MLAEIIDAVNKFTLVSVCGVPGVGKSALVKNAVKIIQQEGYVQIVDVLELQNISSLIEHLYANYDKNESLAHQRKSSAERIAELLRNIVQFNSTTILVLDNLDGEWHIQQDQLHDLLIQPLLMPEIPSKFKVIVTSQHCSKLKGLYHKIIPLSGISDDSCADWISTRYSVISYSNSKQLCHILGGIPLAVKMVASFIADPSRSHEYTADKVIFKLNSSEFGDFFEYLVNHSIISEGSSLMNALFLVYDSLETKYRQCIFLLTDLRSDILPHEYIMSFFQSEGENFPNDCIEKLLKLSLMEKVPTSSSTQYRLNHLVMNFIRWLEEPKVGDTFKQMMRRFWGNVVQHHVKEKRIILNERRDVQLAAQIGSNKSLVNSLLPLLGTNFMLMPLFEHALKIIDEQFCHNGFWKEGQSASDLIFAFSSLTKVVYCPEYHPTSLLMRQKNKNLPNNSCSASKCSKKLTECRRELEKLYIRSVRNDMRVAEAYAHYNALLMLTSCTRTSWKSFLFDLAMIITTANIQCKVYCQRVRICSCGTQTSFELGIFEFLLDKNDLSKHYLQKELEIQMTDEYYHCQTILKTLTIMVIHVINQLQSGKDIDAQAGSAVYFIKLHLSYYQFDPTCYLGVMEDLILPFLHEVHPDQEAIAILQNKHQKLVNESISQKHEADAHPLDRYAIFFGLTALKTAQLQEEFEWPEKVEWIKPREVWVCSIIKDKTRKCQDSINLPLLSKVKSTEASINDKTFVSLRYLMKKEEFSEWDKNVKNIPGFYQFMSI